MTFPLYKNRMPICLSDGAVLKRKDKGAYECPDCNREYVVPVDVLMSEARAPKLI